MNTYDAAQPMSTRRLAGHTDLHVVDHNGNDALPGELGEIWLRSPAPKRLYLDNPERNAGILADGWYRNEDWNGSAPRAVCTSSTVPSIQCVSPGAVSQAQRWSMPL